MTLGLPRITQDDSRMTQDDLCWLRMTPGWLQNDSRMTPGWLINIFFWILINPTTTFKTVCRRNFIGATLKSSICTFLKKNNFQITTRCIYFEIHVLKNSCTLTFEQCRFCRWLKIYYLFYPLKVQKDYFWDQIFFLLI